MSEPVLKAVGLSKTFVKDGKRIEAVKNVSLTLSDGEILGIVGESGCGKSTLSRLLMRLLKPDSGEIYLLGESFDSGSLSRLRPKIQMVFQNPADTFNPAYSVGSSLVNAGICLGLSRAECTEKIAELTKLTGLSGSVLCRRPKELSGGQLQRLAIVRALLNSPKVLIADEAVSSLDVSVAANIINLISDLREQFGISIVFISHDLALVSHISDHVGVMLSGEIIESGTPEEILVSPKQEYTRRLLEARL